MKKNNLKIVVAAVALFAVQAAFCGPHHHDDGRGVRLATDIVNLVKAVVTPAPAVVVTPAPAPAPAVVVTPPAVINYGYYNNVYVPCYNGWYYYGNVWCWGGRVPRPPAPPAWRPPHRHHRAVPPPPPRHHRVAPPAPPRPAYRPAPGRPGPDRPMPGRPMPGRPGRGPGR